MLQIWDEARKHRAFREVWAGALLAAVYLGYSLYLDQPWDPALVDLIPARQIWYGIQQNIRSYGATLTAFLVAVGLPRLLCCEAAYGTDALLRTSARGCLTAWRDKVGFTLAYCAVVVGVIGAASLLCNAGAYGFRGALLPVESSVYYGEEALPPLSNLGYCALQYLLLYLGSLYFAGFVLLLAALTGRPALTVVLCGLCHAAAMVYGYTGAPSRGAARVLAEWLYRFGFGGYLLQDSFSWSWYGWPGLWADLWKPVLLCLGLTAAEFALLWLVWRRRAKA